jgi:5'-nucleotidase
MIIIRDKTLVKGDFLIDDKPEVKGNQQPEWEYILYSQPYNQGGTSRRRMTWDNWEEVIRL